MNLETNTLKTDRKIILFPSVGYLWLCDDFPLNIRLYHLVYPSIRHAVLSWKTDDLEIKEQISKTLLPANLKDIENSITKTSSKWRPGFIKEFFENYTKKKFEENQELKERLLATNPSVLKNQLMPGQANFGIKELQEIENFEGKTLMEVRGIILEQKAT